MSLFTCLDIFLVGKKKKSKKSVKGTDDRKSCIDDGKLQDKPKKFDSPSANNGIQESQCTVSILSPNLGKRSSFIPKVPSTDSLARTEFARETAYEGGDEHDEIPSIKKDYSDFDLQAKGELTFYGSNTELNIYGSENKMELDERIGPEVLVATGHVSDPGLERRIFEVSPVLKRSCSNIETKRVIELKNSLNRFSSYSNIQTLLVKGREMDYEACSSPLSVKTSFSADRVMLKKRSSCQILPSRSRKIWWKLFLWSHRNLHKPSAPQQLVSVLSTVNQKVGYSSDTHEPSQKADKMRKNTLENQWVAFSLESSPRERVNAWISSLEECTFFDEENHDGKEDQGTSGPHHLEIGESSGKNHSHTSHYAYEEVLQANNIIQSLNSFSSVAHISGMGLKVIPSISTFVSLRSVNLSGNCIVHITPGSLPKNLHTLDLSRNKISTIEGLRVLTKLRVLNLSYNCISRIGHGLSNCTNLKELYLAGNKISDVEGLHRLLKLTVLDLSFNKIATTKALGQLVANYNSLLALNLLGNPIQSCIGDEQIKKTVLSLLPHISYLNRQQIKQQHRVKEVVTNSIAKAAIGDSGWSFQRRPVRRLGQVSNSLTKSKIGEGSSRAIKSRSKIRHQHSSSTARK